jgi:hypothetical protein
VLVQPATVARWRRQGFWECCRPRSRRRPGRPRIAADIRALIQRMTRQNRLWGAPRIHGELLKLGITVLERTVSRYLPDRTRRPSQTWRTFLANHFSDLTLPSSLASSRGRGTDDILDTPGRPLLSTLMPFDTPRACEPWAVVDWSPSVPRICSGWPGPRADLHHRSSSRPSSGRDPPSRELTRLAQTRIDGRFFAWILQSGTRPTDSLISRRGPKSPSTIRVLLRSVRSLTKARNVFAPLPRKSGL